ncbi:MAG: NAD+ synthase, partial [Candidatus Omnitrophica bacterium]|nr:NAD+ synthase [Candidatus Omnitrophota bacterium]
AYDESNADVVVFPELAVCGYPPEDLLLKAHFVENNIKTLNALAKKVHGISAIVGFVDSDGTGKIYNAAALICDGVIKDVYHKRELPNYGVFDEKRYFTPGGNSGVFDIKGVRVGVNICEDIWIDGNVHTAQTKAGAKVLVNISSSPYETGKLKVREDLLKRRAKEHKIFVLYANVVGGQDELVFDGASMAVSPQGELLARAKQFTEELLVLDLAKAGHAVAPVLPEDEEIYQALVMGTRDYAHKNGFGKVALGLSGGIDSALVAVIAVDAVGKENVMGVSMPSPYNAKATRSDARVLAGNLGIEFIELPIKSVLKQFLKLLGPWFTATGPNIAEENLQARIRGVFLMAFANKFGWLVLTTGNKSEMAVGYCTLYGDMSGGFAPLKDIFKTRVYALCRWRNAAERNPPIPKSILLRAPSAELRHAQTDEETLGPYEDLDQVLSQYIEQHHGAAHIAEGQLPLQYIQKTIKLVDANEYKRRQAPPGVKITARAFGKDWRLPMTNHYKE